MISNRWKLLQVYFCRLCKTVESGRLHTPGHKYSQNLRFQGQYLDRETGLHYNTFRYYDPDTGRFTQHDPQRNQRAEYDYDVPGHRTSVHSGSYSLKIILKPTTILINNKPALWPPCYGRINIDQAGAGYALFILNAGGVFLGRELCCRASFGN
ncbi:TPA: RHS repeat-associated core domain-containing protein [Morganella morganii]